MKGVNARFADLILMGTVAVAVSFSASAVSVRTKAPHNPVATFECRVPRGYDAQRPGTWRVLVLFGGRNTDGKADASGRLGWGGWADSNGVFIVCPAFKDDDYWDPKAWSGRALLDGLAELKKSYNVCATRLFYYGYSAGSQAANLFAAWNPGLCRAWVSHACGVFHAPAARMRDVPGLVTCGDADQARYVISRRFVESARRVGEPVVWKSFPNHPHDVPPGSLALARAFLSSCGRRSAGDLRSVPSGRFVIPVAYIGDDQDGVYYPAASPAAASVLPADRVDLPDRAVADAWGTGDKK